MGLFGSTELGKRVEATGKGMSDDEIKNVTSPSYRFGSETSYNELYKGLGIGLAIVKLIIDAHHGSLDIKSSKGKGTRITVLLPK